MNGTDVFVVAHLIWVKGLAYNETVNNCEVNARDSANGVNLIRLKALLVFSLSKDAGNVLELRNDGLYYGAMTPTVNQVYVSLQGDDANAGTRAISGKNFKPCV